MAKRFIDISTLPKAWRKLDPSLKLTWFYLWNHCDASGVWDIDDDLFEFENGFELNVIELSNALGDLIEFDEDRVLLTNFIFVNQCELSKLKENYNPHKPVFRAIKKNNLNLNPSLNQATLKLNSKLVVGVEVEEEVGDTFGKSENLLEIDNQDLDLICNYFSQTREGQKMKVWSFINRNGQEFINQTKAYIEFKNLSGERSHGWNGYQAEWKDTDWNHKLNQEKKRQDGAKGIDVTVSKVEHNLSEAQKAKKKAGLIS